MLFNSYEFPIFFFVVCLAYFAIPHGARWALLLAASYYFYMTWEPLYVVLLLISTAVDYAAGLAMGRQAERSARTKYLLLSLAANLGLLMTFKYYNFFSDTATSLLHAVGLEYMTPHLNVLLPVGISFYTFQTLSYTIEVYRGNQEPERHAGRFALYVAFFPQLVAGPIERPGRLLPQLHGNHDFDYERVRAGLAQMLWGLFKKMVIADRLAVIVDFVFDNPERCPGVLLTIGALFFTIQIYCDFSGYSDIAIGAARVLGIDLMKNFNRPFLARSIRDFWRRWHISLSTWFRDYVYIPLGGNRVSALWWGINILAVYTVSGLWHGASGTFVVWGALHGFYYLFGRATAGLRAVIATRMGAVASGFAKVGTVRGARASLGTVPIFAGVHHAVQVGTTFVLVCGAFVVFRASTLSDAAYMAGHVGSGWVDLSAYGGMGELIRSMDLSTTSFLLTTALVVFLFVAERFLGEHDFSALLASTPMSMRWASYAGLILAIMNLGVTNEIPFIYFQF